MRIRSGVAGWDYPDWVGPVYPAGVKGVDRLRFLSRFVDLVEINSTFYRPNDPRHAERWRAAVEARADFRFSAKAHRNWTHEPGIPDVRPCLEGLAPLHEAGRLGALLIQFPPSFRDSEEHVDRILRLAEAATGWPLVVEVRHASWMRPGAWGPFRDVELSRCIVDQPRAGTNVAEATAEHASPIGYLRLHGRRASAWFDPSASVYDRYDYRYHVDELKPLVGLLKSADAATKFIVGNNHPRGQALVNALQVRNLLGEPDLEAPAGLVEAYREALPFARGLKIGLF